MQRLSFSRECIASNFMSTKALTKEEMKKRIAKVDAFKAQGLNTDNACKKAGYVRSNYYLWRRKLGAGEGVKVIEHVVEPVKRAKFVREGRQPLVMIAGSAQELARFYAILGGEK